MTNFYSHILPESVDYRNVSGLKAKENYRNIISFSCFVAGVKLGVATSTMPSGGKDINVVKAMLSSFKKKAEQYCLENPAVHSVWVEVLHGRKEITVCTLFDESDFDAEHKVFQELYDDLPVFIGDYYIDRSMNILHGRDPYDVLSDEFKPVFLRK